MSLDDPRCCVCGADGVVIVQNGWYCIDHIDEAFLGLAALVARFHGWDEADTEQELTEWLTAEPPEPTNQGEEG